MNRRMALAAAGTAALVLATGSAAVAANLGILGRQPDGSVGQLDADAVAELAPNARVASDPTATLVPPLVPSEEPGSVVPNDDADGADDGPLGRTAGVGQQRSAEPAPTVGHSTVAPSPPTAPAAGATNRADDDDHEGHEDEDDHRLAEDRDDGGSGDVDDDDD